MGLSFNLSFFIRPPQEFSLLLHFRYNCLLHFRYHGKNYLSRRNILRCAGCLYHGRGYRLVTDSEKNQMFLFTSSPFIKGRGAQVIRQKNCCLMSKKNAKQENLERIERVAYKILILKDFISTSFPLPNRYKTKQLPINIGMFS